MSTATAPVDRLRAQLEKVRPSGDGFTARCPAHEDDQPSLSFSEGDDGRALVNCHAGCSTEDVVEALGLEMDDLFPSENGGPTERRGFTVADYADYVGLPEGWLRSEFGVRTEREPGKAPTVAIPYRDSRGGTVRTRHRTRDSFWWARDGDGVTLYGLHRLADADPSRAVLLVEGESDVHALAFHDVLAVGVPGASSWRGSWARHLKDRDVFVWMEPDQGGRQLVSDVAEDLPRAHVLEAPDDAADPAELHTVTGDDFRERLGELTRVARPIREVESRSEGGSVNTVNAQRGAEAPEPEAMVWGDPLPLGPDTPDPYPLDALPDWLSRYVLSVATATQTPTDLPLMVGLSALSVATANVVRLRVKRGFTVPGHVWTATVLPPASRKSPVFRHMTRPVFEYESELADRTAPERQRARDERDVLDTALKDAKRAAAKAAGGEGFGEARQRVHGIREKLDRLDVPSEPRLVASDVTSEKLARMMAKNAGRIAVLAPEGDLFRIMAGRYSGGVNVDHHKRGWTGDEPIRDDRMGRDGTHVPRPALTMGLTLQPSVLETLEAKESFRGEGLLGRFLYAVPDSGIGRRRTGDDVPELNRDAARLYDRNLRQLLDAEPRGVTEDGEYEPHDLTLSPGAREAWDAFAGEVEAMLGPGGRLEHVPDWGGKLVGHTLRVALLLHAAHRVGQELDPWGSELSESALRSAVEIGRAAVPHALQVFDALEADPEVRLARYLLKRIRQLTDRRDDPPTKRDLHRACQQKRGLGTAEELDRVLGTLEDHHLARVVQRPTDGPGRTPSPWVVLHPDATSDVDRIDRTPPAGGSGAGSVNSVNIKRGGDTDDDSPDSEPEVLL